MLDFDVAGSVRFGPEVDLAGSVVVAVVDFGFGSGSITFCSVLFDRLEFTKPTEGLFDCWFLSSLASFAEPGVNGSAFGFIDWDGVAEGPGDDEEVVKG